MRFELLGAIDPNGCQEIEMMEGAVQTYYNYVNGLSGYIVFGVGLTAILVAIFGKKFLSQLPGWLTGVIVAGLAIGALPAILAAFGINVGCDGGGGGGGGSGVVDGGDVSDNALGATDMFTTNTIVVELPS